MVTAKLVRIITTKTAQEQTAEKKVSLKQSKLKIFIIKNLTKIKNGG